MVVTSREKVMSQHKREEEGEEEEREEKRRHSEAVAEDLKDLQTLKEYKKKSKSKQKFVCIYFANLIIFRNFSDSKTTLYKLQTIRPPHRDRVCNIIIVVNFLFYF